jgi:hypothetical protein
VGRNKKRRPKKTPPREQRRPVPRLEAEIDALFPEFVNWIGDGRSYEENREVVETAKSVLAIHQQLQPQSSSTSYRALILEASICWCVDLLASGDDYFVIPFVNSLALYTNFLEQTGRWTGSVSQLEELRVFYQRAHVAFNAIGPRKGYKWPDLDPAEQLEFLEGMPLVKYACRLVADLDAQLGSAAGVPWRQAYRTTVASFAADLPAEDDPEGTAFDIFVGFGISEFSGSPDGLADIRKILNGGDTEDRLLLLRTIVDSFFENAFSIGCENPYVEDTGVRRTLGRLLVRAASTTRTVSRLILTNPGALMPAGLTEDAAAVHAEVARLLAHLHKLGLVVLAQGITVPAALRDSVLLAWEESERDRQAA